jgi:hypothetical protein
MTPTGPQHWQSQWHPTTLAVTSATRPLVYTVLFAEAIGEENLSSIVLRAYRVVITVQNHDAWKSSSLRLVISSVIGGIDYLVCDMD